MDQADGGMFEEEEGCVVRVRGLPWSASHEEVKNFLQGVTIVGIHFTFVRDGRPSGEAYIELLFYVAGVTIVGIHFTFVRDGRPSGEAYIELASEEDVHTACKRDKEHMGKRYIEVFRSKKSEMDWVVKRSGPNQVIPNDDAVIRLRGLPFGCSKEEVAHFFTGMEIVPNGITLLQDPQGRTTGDAYVQFANQGLCEMAQAKHKERIGHRYIEIFKSSLVDLKTALNPRNKGMMAGPMRPSPYDRGNDRGFGMGGGMGGCMGGMSGGMGNMGGGMGYGRGKGRGNVKGFYDDYEEDFGGGFQSGGGGFGQNQMGGGRRGGGGGGMGGGGGGRFGSGMMGGGGGRSGGGSGRGGGGSGGAGSDHQSTTGHSIHMRGLPFAANEQDVHDYFKGLTPVNVVIHFNSEGRASGECDVDFASHEEATEGMKRDRGTMQHRYIELFMKSSGNSRSSSSYGGGYGGGNSGFGGGSSGFGGGNNMNNGFNSSGMSQQSYGSDGNGYSSGYGNSNMGGNMGGGFASGMGGGGNMGGNPNYTAF